MCCRASHNQAGSPASSTRRSLLPPKVRYCTCSISTQTLLLDRYSSFGQACDAFTPCDPHQLTVCVNGKCGCTTQRTYREERCLLPGECGKVRALIEDAQAKERFVQADMTWYVAEEGCRYPKEGEVCKTRCDNDQHVCVDKYNNGTTLCVNPMRGDPCVSTCGHFSMKCDDTVCY